MSNITLNVALPTGLVSPIASRAPQQTSRQLATLFGAAASGTQGAMTVKAGNAAVAATGYINLNSASGTVGAIINGVTVSVAAEADDNATATAIAAAVNASADPLVVRAVTAARTLVSATGTFTCSGASGTKVVKINNNSVSFNASGTDTQDALALAAAINANATVKAIVSATSSGAVVTVTALDNETYGGRLGNAISLAGTTGVARSDEYLTGGTTRVTFTPTEPGFAGNWVTLAESGTGITKSAARLTGGTATLETFSFA